MNTLNRKTVYVIFYYLFNTLYLNSILPVFCRNLLFLKLRLWIDHFLGEGGGFSLVNQPPIIIVVGFFVHQLVKHFFNNSLYLRDL